MFEPGPEQEPLIDVWYRVLSSSYLASETRGRKKSVPGMGKSLLDVQKEQDDVIAFVSVLTAARESRKRFGKTDHPARHRCARDTPTTTSVLFGANSIIVFISPEQLLYASREVPR